MTNHRSRHCPARAVGAHVILLVFPALLSLVFVAAGAIAAEAGVSDFTLVSPERIQTGWWRGRTVGRDYYRVETACGRRFWLFRRLRDGRWFLHGAFE